MKRKDIIEAKLEQATQLSKCDMVLQLENQDLFLYATDRGTKIQTEYIRHIRNICNYLLDNSGYDKDFNIDPLLKNVADDIENKIFDDIKSIQHTVSYEALDVLIESWGD